MCGGRRRRRSARQSPEKLDNRDVQVPISANGPTLCHRRVDS